MAAASAPWRQTEWLEDETAAVGRRMGANQLVVLNVYDVVSEAPGGPRRPALSGVGTPARCFLPRASASSLVLRGGGEGTVALSSNPETGPRASWRCPSQSERGLGLEPRPSPQLPWLWARPLGG